MKLYCFIIFSYLWCGYYLNYMQRNYKSVSNESAFLPSGLSDSPLSAETSLFNIMKTKAIPGFPNYYISDEGDVFSDMTGKWIKLKHDINWSGYHRVSIRYNGTTIRKSVHRLVAEAFVPNPYNLLEVDHIDFNRGNNKSTNLMWLSRLDNQRHSILHGRRDHLLGENHHKAVLTESDVRQIRNLYVPYKFTTTKLAKMFGVNHKTIVNIVLNRTWKHILYEKNNRNT